MKAEEWQGALVAEFAEPDALVTALRRAREAGYSRIDAFTPFPVEGAAEALDLREGWLVWVATGGFLAGGALGYLMQWYLNGVNYPINVGGRPLAAWPAFTLPAFEIAVLFAVFAAIAAMLYVDRLPRLNHPLFELERFGLVSRDRFFLAIAPTDPRFEAEGTRAFLAGLGPARIDQVPR
ncbi:MAG: DUF3341 domain-containing protein [Rhodospirillales bacterium]|nr:DUF3341 domain-containing protein [Rhodospirillales bacterium]